MTFQQLTDRERRVLEAVIQSYVQTAEPAGSQAIARRFGLGVSPATIRNTMSELEEKGFLFHPHTSAGRIPTDKAYRLYVNSLMRIEPVAADEGSRLAEQLSSAGSAVEAILRRAAQSLGVLTQELGVAIGPRLDLSVLQRIALVRASAERLLMVLSLSGGAMRTIFVEVPGAVDENAMAEVGRLLNERLGGLTLREIRGTFAERLRDSAPAPNVTELLNIFVQEGNELFDVPSGDDDGGVHLGQPSLLAEQPEFSSGESMRKVLALTEMRRHLGDFLSKRSATPGISISIGNEHEDPRLENFTVVTAEYRAGSLVGVIGVIGPTRMPYDKVISLVSHTSQLVSDLLD